VGNAALGTEHILLTNLLTYLLTYLLTPWNRVLAEKLTGSQLVKKIPAFYGTRRFITTFLLISYLCTCKITTATG